MRKVLALVGALLIVGSAWAGWVLASTFTKIDGSEFVIPGSITLHLDEGTYRIYIRNQLVNKSQCDPDDHIAEIRDLGLQLVPADGGRKVRPQASGTCDGGIDQNGVHPVSVSEFNVEVSGDYEFRAKGVPGLTANHDPPAAYLTDSSYRFPAFVAALAGLLAGIYLLIFGLSRGRNRNSG